VNGSEGALIRTRPVDFKNSLDCTPILPVPNINDFRLERPNRLRSADKTGQITRRPTGIFLSSFIVQSSRVTRDTTDRLATNLGWKILVAKFTFTEWPPGVHFCLNISVSLTREGNGNDFGTPNE
jgi:hypothetical protein